MFRNRRAKRLIRKAAKVIESDGLARRDLGRIDGPKCVMGALFYVAMGSPQGIARPKHKGYDKANDAIQLLNHELRNTNQTVTTFNDDRHNSEQDVVDFLRRVAK
jgi:hypothetical protein